ncbi:unnamed protein product [Closterium sp. NIES-54]
MEVARTSMIHAAAPHFLWPFAGSRAFVRDASADKLSARAIPCVFLGFVPDAPGWQFYHPTSRSVLPSQGVTFDKSVPFYRLFPYRSAPSPPPPLFLAPGPPPVDPLPPQGPAPSGVSQVDPLPGIAPVQVAIVSGAAPGAASGGAVSGGAEPRGVGSEGAGSGGAEPEGVEPGGAESEDAEPEGAESEGAESGGAEPRVLLHRGNYGTAFLQGSLHEEIWLRPPPGFTGSFLTGQHFLRTNTSLPPFYVLVYVDDLVFATANTEALTLFLQRSGFQYSSPQLTPLSTSHSLSAPPSDESVEPSGPSPELVGCLMYLMTCTPPDLAFPLSLLARYVTPGRHRKVHWDAAKRVLRYLCSTSGMGLVLGGRGPVVLIGHADASWELRWLTYLLTDLGEQPRSPPVLYVDNKAMIALCQEHRLEHRTKHIALRYFLARELQQRGQLRLAYVATRANTADVFTKAFPPGDHQRFVPVLGLVTRDRARCTITLTQSHMVHQVLQRFGFQFSSPQPTPLSTSHSLSAPPSDKSVELSSQYPELVGCLMYLMTCTRPNLAYPLSLLARYVAPGRHQKVHWDAAKMVLRYLCSTSGMGLVLGGPGPVVLTSHADASWELRWLTYLLTDLGEQPRSPRVLYVDNKAMIAF